MNEEPTLTGASLPQVPVLTGDYLADETVAVSQLLELARGASGVDRAISARAEALIEAIRARPNARSGLRVFLREYDLSSQEGVMLLCLAEALLRIPDPATMDALIADRIGGADWQCHVGQSESLLVNASTWALMLSGRVIRLEQQGQDALAFAGRLLARLEEPVLRMALTSAVTILAAEFVMGPTIAAALARARHGGFQRNRMSYDMLGEAALGEPDCMRYAASYRAAIEAIGATIDPEQGVHARPGISVKLSAIHSRFEPAQWQTAIAEASARLLELARAARAAGIALTVDAEEADRLGITLAVFEGVYRDLSLGDWDGFGLAVQAYQKRALAVIEFLARLACDGGRTIPVRLVKGAYWDTEIKRAQVDGLADYPVFTRKCNTDVSYLACARRLLAASPHLYAQFATHNAHTVSYVLHHAAEQVGCDGFEFQRLHGMGEALYDTLLDGSAVPCRVYAPVGAHVDLLPYLVRRLLENGANTSFIHQLTDTDVPAARLAADPIAAAADTASAMRHPRIPRPRDLYTPARLNSRGTNFADPAALAPLVEALDTCRAQTLRATPWIAGEAVDGVAREVRNPAYPDEIVGRVVDADAGMADQALAIAAGAFEGWRSCPAGMRADMLERAADDLEAQLPELVALCVREAGKTLRDAHDDVREAIDFLRYYAAEARRLFTAPRALPGPTGESNVLYLAGRGVFVCVSPWNFPAAIFTGQIAAALAAGNSVIAKPAEQTTLVAARITAMLHRAGVPGDVLGFLPGDGPTLGKALVGDRRVAGVAVTGSTTTAAQIQCALAAREGPLATLIAETGGINALIADSSALPEQLVRDAALSAFNSAGQRCSALRVLCLQEEIAPRVLRMLGEFVDTWVIGDPACLATDMGPVIDSASRVALEDYIARHAASGRLLYRGPAPRSARDGHHVRPAILGIDAIAQLEGEIFGPVLHVLRYQARDLDALIDRINSLGYGLTLGVHSRIEARAEHIRRRARVGNVYVNRTMVGAVVGVQPFGGCGLSGTGPKAGGPHYLTRFATEQTFTTNTAALGGNAALLGGDA